MGETIYIVNCQLTKSSHTEAYRSMWLMILLITDQLWCGAGRGRRVRRHDHSRVNRSYGSRWNRCSYIDRNSQDIPSIDIIRISQFIFLDNRIHRAIKANRDGTQ